jgi:hypothetical protein
MNLTCCAAAVAAAAAVAPDALQDPSKRSPLQDEDAGKLLAGIRNALPVEYSGVLPCYFSDSKVHGQLVDAGRHAGIRNALPVEYSGVLLLLLLSDSKCAWTVGGCRHAAGWYTQRTACGVLVCVTIVVTLEFEQASTAFEDAGRLLAGIRNALPVEY